MIKSLNECFTAILEKINQLLFINIINYHMEITEVSPVEIKSLWHFDRVSGKSVSKYLFDMWNGKHAQSEKRGLNTQIKKRLFPDQILSVKCAPINIIYCFFQDI